MGGKINSLGESLRKNFFKKSTSIIRKNFFMCTAVKNRRQLVKKLFRDAEGGVPYKMIYANS